MSTAKRIVAVMLAGASVAGCRMPFLGGAKAPQGQVVATVDGKEITQLDLQAELAHVNTPDPKARKAAEQKALQVIIARRVVADAARKEHLDKTPDFAIQRERGIDNLLAQMLQAKQAAAVPTPTDEEVRRYVEAHPDTFAQRKVYALDTIRMAPMSPALMKGLQPLDTMDQVDAYLTANKVPHARGASNLDALTASPELIDAVLKVPSGQVFIYSADGNVLANQIRGSQVVPVPNDAALKYAAAEMKQKRIQEAASRQVSQLLAQAAPKIQYNPAYKPPSPAAKPEVAAK